MEIKKDCSHLLVGKDPSRILKKILVVLSHQITKDDVERQLKIIDIYFILSSKGFLVKDLYNIMYLFERLRTKMKLAEFEEKLNKLLDLCSIPPVLTKSTEVLDHDMDLKEYFSWMGYVIVWLKEKKYQKKIIKAIYSLLTRQCAEREYLSLEVRMQTARMSNLALILGDLLEIVEEDIYLEILKVVEVLIKESKETCERLLAKGVVSSMIARLEPKWRQRYPNIKPGMPLHTEQVPKAETIFFILIALLQKANKELMRAPSKFTLWSLQWAFRLFTIKGTTEVERNNVLCILLLILDVYPDALLGNLTLSYDIAMLAMSKDIVFRPNWTTEVKLTTSHENLSCMALLLICISYLPNTVLGFKVIEECRVVMGLLKIIANQQAIKWHQLQACYLIRLSLNILHKIVPESTEEFIEDGGPLLILQLLNRARENHEMYCYDIVYRSIELLSYLSYKFTTIRESIAYNGGVYCILQLCHYWLTSKQLVEEYQILLAVGICLLEQICIVEEACRVLPLIIDYMKRYVNPSEIDQIQNPKLIIICLSYVWNKIVSSTVNSTEFVRMSGVYLMLDIAQISCLPVKLVVLGTLIDLCERVECIPYLITWRKNEQGIVSLLMHIFREENEQLLVKSDENGIIKDYLYPIMGETQFYETYCMCEKHVGNASIADLFISSRPKVYCLLQILNHKQAETVEMANEFYKIYGGELTALDQVTYVLAENFLALKLGEEWKEIQQDLKKMKIEAIPSDDAVLKIMNEITDKWSKDLQRMQEDIMKKYLIKERKKEETLYKRLKDSRLADAWDALCEMKYLSRCSERFFRVSSNLNLQKRIKKSIKINEENGKFHTTFQSNVNVTCLRHQNVSVPSEIHEDSKSTVLPAFISPIGSTEYVSYDDDDEPPCGEYLPEDSIPTFESK